MPRSNGGQCSKRLAMYEWLAGLVIIVVLLPYLFLLFTKDKTMFCSSNIRDITI